MIKKTILLQIEGMHMSEKMTSINPQILVWCRNASGISLEEASNKFGEEKISSWESGADFPTYNQLQQLCDFYRKPIAVCFFPEPPAYKSLPASFRTIPTIIQGSLLNHNIVKFIDEARVMQLNLYELNENNNIAYSFFASHNFSTVLPKMAKELRQFLNVSLSQQKRIKKSSEHFEFWREKFSELGIYVFKNALGDNNISGFCLYDEVFPVIYINNSLSFTRQIFTLFHELCHIIFKTSGIDVLNDCTYHNSLAATDLEIERACNAFAGAFLVPDDDFAKQTRGKTPTEKCVSDLATLYGVSREVILRKFLDAHCITPDEYVERSAQYTQDYFRTQQKSSNNETRGNYYNTQASYKGTQYTELVFNRYYANRITLTQAAQYMNMKIPSIKTFAEKKGWGSL